MQEVFEDAKGQDEVGWFKEYVSKGCAIVYL